MGNFIHDSFSIEDCLKQIPNRFQLVVLASHRARQILARSSVEQEVGRLKKESPVLALHEIARGDVSKESIIESIILSYQSRIPGFPFGKSDNARGESSLIENIEHRVKRSSVIKASWREEK